MTDLTTCDREPIHTPGAILLQGALLVLDGVDLTVLQADGATTNAAVSFAKSPCRRSLF